MASFNVSSPSTTALFRSLVCQGYRLCNGLHGIAPLSANVCTSDSAFVRLGSRLSFQKKNVSKTRAALVSGEADILSYSSINDLASIGSILDDKPAGIEAQLDAIAFGSLSADTALVTDSFSADSDECDLDCPTEGFSSIPEAIEDIRRGKVGVSAYTTHELTWERRRVRKRARTRNGSSPTQSHIHRFQFTSFSRQKLLLRGKSKDGVSRITCSAKIDDASSIVREKSVSVILLAGGKGKRMGGTTSTWMLDELASASSLCTFASMVQVKEIVVVCDPSYQDIFEGLSPRMLRDDRVQICGYLLHFVLVLVLDFPCHVHLGICLSYTVTASDLTELSNCSGSQKVKGG